MGLPFTLHEIPVHSSQSKTDRYNMSISQSEIAIPGMPAIVASPAMQQVVEMAQKIARSNAAVLITGESGSGKELIARALHHFSLRCAKPWVDINCGALPDHLMESELFGYEKGAFSGADSSKPGMFELAHTGTLFLDEVAELDSRMQVKLLRVLDGAPYFRLGGTRKISVDARIVAATNHDLEDAVRRGKFRGDLYHRLCQIRIQVPPLRERPEDVEALAAHFLSQARPDLHWSEAALAVLRGHSWPGNVRELRNLVTKIGIFADGPEVGRADLPPEMTAASTAAGPATTATLDGLEKQAIFRALHQTGGHQERAARILGISRRTLIRKLKIYNGHDTCIHSGVAVC